MAVAACIHALQHTRHQRAGIGRLLVGVGDAEASADIDMMNRDALRFDGFDKVQHAVQRVEKGFKLRDLRADVAVDAHHAQAR